jgi:hypothetical protein
MMTKSSDGLCLPLDKRLYSSGAVDLAVSGFSEVCGICVKDSGGKRVVVFSGLPDEELEQVALEFANYVLSFAKAGC